MAGRGGVHGIGIAAAANVSAKPGDLHAISLVPKPSRSPALLPGLALVSLIQGWRRLAGWTLASLGPESTFAKRTH